MRRHPSQDHAPQGNALAGDPVTGERQTFNCQERDRENGLFDLGDQNLDALTGRFIRIDRLWENERGLTPYHYAANNPVRMTDPTGLQARVLNEALHVDQGGGSSSGSSGARMGNAIGRVVGNALDKAAMSLASAALFPICPACPTIDLAMNPKATVKAYAEMGGNLVGANGAEAAATEWLSLGIQAAVLGGATRISGVRAAPVAAKETPPIVSTTEALVAQLTDLAREAIAEVGEGRGPAYGTRVHTAFERRVDALNRPDVRPEVSYLNGNRVARGTAGSVRADVVVGPVESPWLILDLKTGTARLTVRRIQQIQSHLPEGSYPAYKEIRP